MTHCNPVVFCIPPARDRVGRYGIEVLYPAGSFKQGLQDLLDTSEVQCIFIGTRRIDPHGPNMEMLHLTDASWYVSVQ